ncbi:hypothetical protein MJO29_011833 [Puccinia striiformis f. sp. tritici]|nr:hypothetical protein MJO29_011833 [Puccinia striiformis f. sp. tritici]
MSSSHGIVHDIPGGGMSGSPYSEIVDPIIDLLVAYMVMIGWTSFVLHAARLTTLHAKKHRWFLLPL